MQVHCISVSEHVWVVGRGGGGGGGCYQPGVYVPLKALFLVLNLINHMTLFNHVSLCHPLCKLKKKRSSGVPTRYDIYRPVQLQKMSRSFKFRV